MSLKNLDFIEVHSLLSVWVLEEGLEKRAEDLERVRKGFFAQTPFRCLPLVHL